jgi:hypothetical protein
VYSSRQNPVGFPHTTQSAPHQPHTNSKFTLAPPQQSVT